MRGGLKRIRPIEIAFFSRLRVIGEGRKCETFPLETFFSGVDTRGCARGRRIDLHSNTRHHAVERVDFSARVPFALSILEFRKKRKKKNPKF